VEEVRGSRLKNFLGGLSAGVFSTDGTDRLPDMSVPGPSLIKLAWEIISAPIKWVAGYFERRAGRSPVISVPGETFIAMPAPTPNSLWWCRAKDRTGEDAMQICCNLQITNIAKMGVRLSAVKVSKPKGAVVKDAIVLVENEEGAYSFHTIIPAGSIALARCTVFMEPVSWMVGQPLMVELELYDQFNNCHRVDGLDVRYVGEPR
jgi:hypothetical protein